jgi:hypothetical protein
MMGSPAWNADAAGAVNGQLLPLSPLRGSDTLSVRTGPESTVTLPRMVNGTTEIGDDDPLR